MIPSASTTAVLRLAGDEVSAHAGCANPEGDSGLIALASRLRELARFADGSEPARIREIRDWYSGHERPEVDDDIDWLIDAVVGFASVARMHAKDAELLRREVESLRRQLEHQVHGRVHD